MSEENEQTEDNSAVEAEAMKMGWRPKTEWKGADEDFIEASDFVERGRNMLPIIKANMRTLEQKMERERKQHERDMAELKEIYNKKEIAAYERARKEILDRQVQAVADGDGDKYREASEELEALKPDTLNLPKQVPQAWVDWKTSNEWYESDPEMTAIADDVGKAFMQKFNNGQMTLEQALEATTKRVKAIFPEKFAEEPRKPSAVAAPTQPAQRNGKKSFDNLPAEAKAQCDRFVKLGVLKSREDYVANYSW